jgi:hypothetical protein
MSGEYQLDAASTVLATLNRWTCLAGFDGRAYVWPCGLEVDPFEASRKPERGERAALREKHDGFHEEPQ